MSALVLLLSIALPFLVFYGLGRWLRIANPYGDNWWRYGLATQWVILLGWVLMRGVPARLPLLSCGVTVVAVWLWWRRDGRFFLLLTQLRQPSRRARALDELRRWLSLDAVIAGEATLSTRHALYASSALIEAEQPLTVVNLLDALKPDGLHVHEQIHRTNNLAIAHLMLHQHDKAYEHIDAQRTDGAHESMLLGLDHTRALVLSVRGQSQRAADLLARTPGNERWRIARMMIRANIAAEQGDKEKAAAALDELKARYGEPALRQLAALSAPASSLAAAQLSGRAADAYRR